VYSSFGREKELRSRTNASWAARCFNLSPSLLKDSTFSAKAAETQSSSPSVEPNSFALQEGISCAPGRATSRVPHVVISSLTISHFAAKRNRLEELETGRRVRMKRTCKCSSCGQLGHNVVVYLR